MKGPVYKALCTTNQWLVRQDDPTNAFEVVLGLIAGYAYSVAR